MSNWLESYRTVQIQEEISNNKGEIYLVAPVQITFPEDQIVAVILGFLSFINTFWNNQEKKENWFQIETFLMSRQNSIFFKSSYQ